MFLVGRYGRRLFEGEGMSGGGGNPAPAPAPGGGAEHPASAPWGTEGVWQIGEEGKQQPWWTTLPDEAARKHIEAKQYANPAELALANYNLTRLQTGDPQVITLPPADASPEVLNAFYTKLGRPESADKYDIKIADGVTVDDGMLAFGKSLGFELGLNGKQMQTLTDKWNAYALEQNAAAQKAANDANDAAIAALETKWGTELQANKAAGLRAAQALGLSAESMNAIEGAVGAAPLIELLAVLGKKTAEGGFTAPAAGAYDAGNPATMNPTQASERITQLQADPAFMAKYGDKNNPGHQDAVKMMEQLFARSTAKA